MNTAQKDRIKDVFENYMMDNHKQFNNGIRIDVYSNNNTAHTKVPIWIFEKNTNRMLELVVIDYASSEILEECTGTNSSKDENGNDYVILNCEMEGRKRSKYIRYYKDDDLAAYILT